MSGAAIIAGSSLSLFASIGSIPPMTLAKNTVANKAKTAVSATRGSPGY